MRVLATLVARLLVVMLVVPLSLAGEAPDPKWLDKSVSADDLAAATQFVGFALPAATPGVRWFGGAPEDPCDGKVTVVQVFSMKEGGRPLIRKLRDSVPNGTRLVIIHAQVEAERVVQNLEKSPPAMPIAVDTDGAWLKSMGLDGKPINMVIDTNGAVRYAGLRTDMLRKALASLLEEKPDPAKRAKRRPPSGGSGGAGSRSGSVSGGTSTPSGGSTPPTNPPSDGASPPPPSGGSTPPPAPPGGSPPSSGASGGANAPPAGVDFPVFTDRIESAIDRRGQHMAAFHVDQWISPQPQTPANRLLVIDFWATWCKPCRASVPHLNEIATTWPDMVLVVGITDEPAQAVVPALRMYGMSLESFKYPVASDPNKNLFNFFGVGGIPHGVVVSADGIVRWQGHPSMLTPEVMERLVQAQRSANGGGSSKGSGSRR
jgi:thiol-disulfide isomerase/thioredoxin